MEEVKALAEELMSTRGDNCQALVAPKMKQLNQRFDTIAQRITSGLVGQIPPSYSEGLTAASLFSFILLAKYQYPTSPDLLQSLPKVTPNPC